MILYKVLFIKFLGSARRLWLLIDGDPVCDQEIESQEEAPLIRILSLICFFFQIAHFSTKSFKRCATNRVFKAILISYCALNNFQQTILNAAQLNSFLNEQVELAT